MQYSPGATLKHGETHLRYACSVFVTSVVHWDSKRDYYTLYLFSGFYSEYYSLCSTCTNSNTGHVTTILILLLFPVCKKTHFFWFKNILAKNLEFRKIFEDKKKLEEQLIALHKERPNKNFSHEEFGKLNEKVSFN